MVISGGSADMAGRGRLLPRPSAPSLLDPSLDSLLGYQQQQQELNGTSDLILWPFESDCHPEMDVNSYPTMDMTNLSSNPLESNIFPIPGLTQSETTAQESSSSSSSSPLSSSNSSSTTATATTATSTHDCEAQAISILRSMQHGEMYEGTTSCSTNPAQYAALNLRPGFDRVLATNKAALDGCARLMQCSCALCPHIILLHVSVLSKMLFWYRIAAIEEEEGEDKGKEDRASKDGTMPRDTNNNNDNGSNGPRITTTQYTPQDPPSPGRFGVSPTGIQVGMLQLDAEGESDVRRALLLRELRRAETVIDELINVDRTALDEGGDELVRSSVQWSLGGIERVREELRGVMGKIQGHKKARSR